MVIELELGYSSNFRLNEHCFVWIHRVRPVNLVYAPRTMGEGSVIVWYGMVWISLNFLVQSYIPYWIILKINEEISILIEYDDILMKYPHPY